MYAANGQLDEAIIRLERAVALEDALNYNEPPDWFFSIRHHLGAMQLKASKFDEAIITYKEDLAKLPRNGWAYHGLKTAYEALGDTENASVFKAMYESSWAHADFELE